LDIERLYSGKPPASHAPPALGGKYCASSAEHAQKNVTIFGLQQLIQGLHIV